MLISDIAETVLPDPRWREYSFFGLIPRIQPVPQSWFSFSTLSTAHHRQKPAWAASWLRPEPGRAAITQRAGSDFLSSART